MNNRLKELFLGMVLLFICNVFSMDSSDQASQFRTRLLQERKAMWQLVKAKELDHIALTTDSPQFLFINDRDDVGCTPLHYLMRHKDAKVEHVAFFITKRACLDVDNDYGRDPYDYSFMYKGHTPDSEPLHNCDRKVVHFLHSEKLLP